MPATADFQLVSPTQIPGITLIMPMNEDAFSYLTDEALLSTLNDGSAPLATERVNHFVSDAGKAHFYCAAA
jgi:hypothetical protein